MWNKVKQLCIAFGIFALLFVVFGWNLPVTSSCQPHNNKNQEAATNKTWLIPLSQVNQNLGLAGQIRNWAGFEFFGRS
jgi:hypothetical protein